MAWLQPRVVAKEQLSTNDRFSLAESLPLLVMHLALVSVFFVGVSVPAVVAMLVTYAVRVFALTGGYHRYFSHRSYKTSRFFQFVMAYLGATAAQQGPLWWAAHHRHHHQFSDLPGDAHSPRLQGAWYAHMGWLLCPKNSCADRDRVKDLMRYPELCWIDRYHVVAPLSLAGGLYALGAWLQHAHGVATSGWQMLVWGFVVSTVMVYHVTFCINSVTHIIGKRRFPTQDDSRNSLLLALLTMGEGWHNNHHRYPVSCRQGFYPWEIDATYYVLLMLSKLGVVWELQAPPASIYAEASAIRAASAAGKPG
jgi:stearoyl-CoA desaturase (delta-9 desaturase)